MQRLIDNGGLQMYWPVKHNLETDNFEIVFERELDADEVRKLTLVSIANSPEHGLTIYDQLSFASLTSH